MCQHHLCCCCRRRVPQVSRYNIHVKRNLNKKEDARGIKPFIKNTIFHLSYFRASIIVLASTVSMYMGKNKKYHMIFNASQKGSLYYHLTSIISAYLRVSGKKKYRNVVFHKHIVSRVRKIVSSYIAEESCKAHK